MVLMINTYCVCCLRLCLHRLNKPAFRVLNYFSNQVLCLFCLNSWFSSPEHYDKCSIRTTWCKKEGRNENTIRQTRLCHYVSWSIASTQLWQTLWFETAHLLAEYSSEVLIWLEHFCFIQIYALLDSILLLKLVKTCFLFPFPFPPKKISFISFAKILSCEWSGIPASANAWDHQSWGCQDFQSFRKDI